MIEASLELDDAVATKVMGHTYCAERVVVWSISGIMNSWDCPHHDATHYCSGELPGYSGNISAAMLVVEHLQSKGFHWRMKTGIDFQPLRTVWCVETDNFDIGAAPGDRSATTNANTLPLAICLAALEVSQ